MHEKNEQQFLDSAPLAIQQTTMTGFSLSRQMSKNEQEEPNR